MLPPLVCAVASVFVFSQCLPFVPKPTRLWRGYYTLYAIKGSAAAQAFKRLSSELPEGRGAVSLYSSRVSFTDFEGETGCTLWELPGRLDESDPRYDPYLKGLAGYFRNGEWEMAYVPSYRSGLGTLLGLGALTGAFLADGARLADVGLIPAVVAVFAALGLAGILSRSARGAAGNPTGICWAHALVWLPVLARSGFSLLCFFTLEFASWFELAAACCERSAETLGGRRRSQGPPSEIAGRLFLYLFLCFTLPALAALMGIASGFLVFAVAADVACSLLLLLVPFPLDDLRRAVKKSGAREVPASQKRGKGGKKPVHAPAVAVFSAACAAVFLVSSAARGIPLPVPGIFPGPRGFDWEYLERRSSEGEEGRLPDMADAAAHAAFQQSLSLGRPYGIPGRDERVYGDEYGWDPAGNRIVRRQVAEKRFDSVWLSAIARDAGRESVERMLLEQGAPRVEVLGAWRRELREAPFAILCIGLLAAALFTRPDPRLLITGKLWRSNEASRKKR